MSRSRNLDRMTRYQWFESGFLQRTACLSTEVARCGREPRLFARVCGTWETVRSAETRIRQTKPARECSPFGKAPEPEATMPSLSDQIAELTELRARAASALNETSRLIRQFCEVRDDIRAGTTVGAERRTELVAILRQRNSAADKSPRPLSSLNRR